MAYGRYKSVKSLYLYFTRVIYLNWTACGLKVFADIFYAFCRASSGFYRCGTAAFSALESLAILYLFILYLKVSLTRKSLFNFMSFYCLVLLLPMSGVWCDRLSRLLSKLVFLIGFPKLASFNLSLSLHLCAFRVSILPNWKVDWLYVVGQIIIFSCRSTCWV